MLGGNCTEALSIQANVTISSSSAKLIKNGIAPLPFPALLRQYWYIKRGERVREGTCSILCNVRVQALPRELSVCPIAGSAAQFVRPALVADGNSHSRTSPLRFATQRPIDCLELPHRWRANWASRRSSWSSLACSSAGLFQTNLRAV